MFFEDKNNKSTLYHKSLNIKMQQRKMNTTQKELLSLHQIMNSKQISIFTDTLTNQNNISFTLNGIPSTLDLKEYFHFAIYIQINNNNILTLKNFNDSSFRFIIGVDNMIASIPKLLHNCKYRKDKSPFRFIINNNYYFRLIRNIIYQINNINIKL